MSRPGTQPPFLKEGRVGGLVPALVHEDTHVSRSVSTVRHTDIE